MPPKYISTLNRHGRQDEPRSVGLNVVFMAIEKPLEAFICVALANTLVTWGIGGSVLSTYFFVSTICAPLVVIGCLLALLVYRSWLDLDAANGTTSAYKTGKHKWEMYITMPAYANKYKGKKLPIDYFIEDYILCAAHIKEGVDPWDVFLLRNEIFRMALTLNHLKFYIFTFLGQKMGHTRARDHNEVATVYDRGNDFYNWFMGDNMLYSSAIFIDPEEDLEVAQKRKLDLICNYARMKPGTRHFDFGCGWGTLVAHAARHFGTDSTGITLSKEQAEWARGRAEREKVSDRVHIHVTDYRDIEKKKYDAITCLEMSEHVGIKNYPNFLAQVYDMLEDDGVFYLQIAGLRRAWQYEDLVWGIFMAKYIFPGAAASCPLGWDIEQVERAGFEVHRVENTGVHYSRTIYNWFRNWMKNEEKVVGKYGQYWYRMWIVFLAWSAIIAGQGSSTVFMITLNKQLKNDEATLHPDSIAAAKANPTANGADYGFAGSAKSGLLNRIKMWIGPKPLATQQ
jgi:cyclopropane fatty-acyl-phospholipid synthase-like methyltransferase